uniref:EH domain-containing protein n=1 Tax=Seriola lalandi dorsalis TaxID=1841481 RepID=A0A3B4XFC8_SERLL
MAASLYFALSPRNHTAAGILPISRFTLDPGNTGKISAGDAAQFLKKSGLSDGTLGKIWDLADSERKGYLDKRVTQNFCVNLL